MKPANMNDFLTIIYEVDLLAYSEVGVVEEFRLLAVNVAFVAAYHGPLLEPGSSWTRKLHSTPVAVA